MLTGQDSAARAVRGGVINPLVSRNLVNADKLCSATAVDTAVLEPRSDFGAEGSLGTTNLMTKQSKTLYCLSHNASGPKPGERIRCMWCM